MGHDPSTSHAHLRRQGHSTSACHLPDLRVVCCDVDVLAWCGTWCVLWCVVLITVMCGGFFVLCCMLCDGWLVGGGTAPPLMPGSPLIHITSTEIIVCFKMHVYLFKIHLESRKGMQKKNS